MILIGMGANLSSSEYGEPCATLDAALEAIGAAGVQIRGVSKWYSTAPLPVSDQPRFVNIVASVKTVMDAGELLTILHSIEDVFGRTRGVRNAARVLDIDLLDYEGQISENWPLLPHPRMSARAFVLVPLRDIAPDWRHPLSGATVSELVAVATDLAGVRVLGEGPGLR
ncbi:MAG: 2-amino-4-hydroxy-6-hydroxymethyldihydropteridine diphosphokinase [Alphaproteobacteria bacterium]|jgi:2-amino-4-hydroxy-6-hydroxymethyldihydropteridine diphosphokinase|nr:2-amino-4-hydroxy-6-hydroxymethyldihydropteridine diphosphokinase [Alphaproteobacteria bacterium]